MSPLNGYLYLINAAQADLRTCGQAKETVEHFLFRCTHWDHYRETMLRQTNSKTGCLSFFFRRKGTPDPLSRKPILVAARATVHYAVATGRLALETTY